MKIIKFQRKRLHVFHIPVAFVKADTIIELFELIKSREIRIPFVMRHRVYGAVLRYAGTTCTALTLV